MTQISFEIRQGPAAWRRRKITRRTFAVAIDASGQFANKKKINSMHDSFKCVKRSSERNEEKDRFPRLLATRRNQPAKLPWIRPLPGNRRRASAAESFQKKNFPRGLCRLHIFERWFTNNEHNISLICINNNQYGLKISTFQHVRKIRLKWIS